MALAQRGQPDGGVAEQLGADHGVEQVREAEAAVALEHEDVVLGGVEDLADLRGGEHRPERREIRRALHGQRVDQEGPVLGADLHQADLVEVVIEAVGLGIDGDDRLAEQIVSKRLEIGSVLDALEIGHDARASGARVEQKHEEGELAAKGGNVTAHTDPSKAAASAYP